MAAPNATLSRPGAINNTTGTWAQDNALFLKVFSGEVLTSFERNCIFDGLVQTRSIQNGKSAQFPVTGRFTSRYMTPGEMLTGQGNMAQNEVVIKIDDLLIADASIFDLDEAKTHYDIRSIYSVELGRAMARSYDKRLARVLTLAARTSTSDLTANLPTGLSPDDPYRVGTRIDINKATPTPDDLVASVFAAAQALDQKDIPADGRVLVCSPDVYYTLIQSSRAVNSDFNQPGANGGYASGQISRLAGFTILSSNHIQQGNVTAPTGEQGYTFGGTDTVLSSVNMSTTKMLAFQKGAVGVVKLRDLTMQMTGNDYAVTHQATLMVSKMAYGAGPLRPEAVVEIHNG